MYDSGKLPVLHQQELVTAVQCETEIMQYEEAGPSALCNSPPECVEQKVPVREVESAVRLVEQQQRRVLHKRAGEDAELLLALAERLEAVILVSGHADRSERGARLLSVQLPGLFKQMQHRLKAHEDDIDDGKRYCDPAALRDVADGARKPPG